ncbi:glycoprotein-N-acetylgalactosamine 3-beta-galactosyltransferase 1 [Drosophila tropicalis]|uniref:glycoprotein-N-acetylgalactosamine 3-beta-galactosyltransferase 1 n=1 Tax=Drosophila tropicalis TaxID=46794 RepID=UPI0035ABA691
MIIFRQQRKRLELLLMLLLGFIWGILLSQLLHRAPFRFSDNDNSLMTSQNPDSTTFLFGSSSSSHRSPSSFNESETMTEHLLLRNEGTRILCMILTGPKTHQTRAIHVKRTWGSRCNKIIFISSKPDTELNTVVLNVREGYSNLYGKTRASLEYVYKHYYHQFDWFLKTDDDTYVILENLREFLKGYTPKLPIYFGSKLQKHGDHDYITGGAGYVLSKSALRRFMTLGFYNSSICSDRSFGIEDVDLGRCLRNVGVVAGDSQDDKGLPRFLPSPHYQNTRSSNATSSDCCSNSAFSFHCSNYKEFYVLDYVIYRLRPSGLIPLHENLSKWHLSNSDKYN